MGRNPKAAREGAARCMKRRISTFVMETTPWAAVLSRAPSFFPGEIIPSGDDPVLPNEDLIEALTEPVSEANRVEA